MNCNPKRGKTILLIIICIMLLLDVSTTALVTYKFGLNRLPSGIMRFFITSIFMYFIYNGSRLVKNLFVGLLLASVVGTIMSFGMSVFLTPALLLLLIIFIVSGVLLMFSRDVRCLFED